MGWPPLSRIVQALHSNHFMYQSKVYFRDESHGQNNPKSVARVHMEAFPATMVQRNCSRLCLGTPYLLTLPGRNQ